MEIFEKINILIKKKKITKRAFSAKLRNLEPKLKITGEIPSENTIYSYLTGRISIPIELLSYIAEALDVTEQELFDTSLKTRRKCFKYFLENAPKEELEYFHNFINSQIHNSIHINYGSVIMSTTTPNEKIEKLTELLRYAPSDFIDKVLRRLEEYEELQGLDI